MKSVRRYKTVAIPVNLWKEIPRVVKASGLYSNEAKFVWAGLSYESGRRAGVEKEKTSTEPF